MPNFERMLNLSAKLGDKSYFLFGPRESGKTHLINRPSWTRPHRLVDLQDSATFIRFSRNPGEALRNYFKKNCPTPGTVVMIDDIHRLPALLDAAYKLMTEETTVRFLFVTSSEHKLLHNGGNVRHDLAGMLTLHSLSANEIGSGFNLDQALTRGLLPEEYNRTSSLERPRLEAYVSLYLQEEIAPRAGTCNISKIHRLLIAMAKHNGELINYADLATQTGLPRSTVQEYVQTVKATGMAYELPAKTGTSRRAIRTAKLYLFDTGVIQYLQNQDPHAPPSDRCATPFQHWVLHELRCFADWIKSTPSLTHWRSTGGHSVDFILNDETAIAANGTTQVGTAELKGLRALREEGACKRYCLVCCEPTERIVDGIEILPYLTFVKRLWDGELV
jgi:predicted AAA+ superfamily ATPase